MTTRVKKKITASPPPTGGVDLAAVGERIRQLRGFKMQQAEFARMLGVSQSQLSKYERGETEPSLDVLVKLSQRFGKTLDWLILGTER